ncbi:tetratricopeptide repeat protein [Fulvivirga sp. RKSG066]|uniref:tetratricopeptide repeat protein n=1 Tax=Fulvivirga aurantia TaxID=2529383 RepID=UPI0012BCEDC0|nr:tetratricopeptide repeat protein [Fulvivirga aurantia]MTI22131.1 tetratricopeptide repeat protein [Fulvivirga aurantia]
MLRTRILLLVSALVLVVIIFNLPKVVVDNDPDKLDKEGEVVENTQQSGPVEEGHTPELTKNDQARANSLKENLRLAKNTEKSLIFADSLAELYLKSNKYDSAAKFIEIIAQENPTEENLLRAGNVYYEAYGFAMDQNKQARLGAKAREYFDKVLAKSPDNLDVKNKLAMTYLTTSNPMQGIMMLRQILEANPENENAIFNLGVLSMQSGQYEKAVERFSALVEINPGHTQGQFFLGVSYLETGQKEKAREQFKLVKTLDDDPAVQATADSYLEEID